LKGLRDVPAGSYTITIFTKLSRILPTMSKISEPAILPKHSREFQAVNRADINSKKKDIQSYIDGMPF
jgi:hypothetical protein